MAVKNSGDPASMQFILSDGSCCNTKEKGNAAQRIDIEPAATQIRKIEMSYRPLKSTLYGLKMYDANSRLVLWFGNQWGNE